MLWLHAIGGTPLEKTAKMVASKRDASTSRIYSIHRSGLVNVSGVCALNELWNGGVGRVDRLTDVFFEPFTVVTMLIMTYKLHQREMAPIFCDPLAREHYFVRYA